MKYLFSTVLIIIVWIQCFPQNNFENVELDNTITQVQPMTGIVYWDNSGQCNTKNISLEFSYMLYNKVVKDSGIYNWDIVESKLNDISSRGHHAIFRFRFVYPGYETSVPDYILNRSDYHETVGLSEGRTTHFPDWENEELKRFTLEFYTKFAEKYDNDPRLAYIQVGFGLWAEYHIYDGPFQLGKTFPSKEFQETFFYHMQASFINIPWSISIDAADEAYSPFKAKPELKDIIFGLFDDSFMHKDHSSWNELEWNFFGRDRYKISPAGGEFSYYSDYDQEHVLDFPNGPYGTSFETWCQNFHITYMIGNDQPQYQTSERIKDASMATGYKFKIVSLKTSVDSSIFEILNYGVAPLYYDAFIAVNGIRCTESLKLLFPGKTKTYLVEAGAKDASIEIECDKLIPGQEIQFYGTQDLPVVSVKKNDISVANVLYPNPARKGDVVKYLSVNEQSSISYSIFNSTGKLIRKDQIEKVEIDTQSFTPGIYFIFIENKVYRKAYKLIVL